MDDPVLVETEFLSQRSGYTVQHEDGALPTEQRFAQLRQAARSQALEDQLPQLLFVVDRRFCPPDPVTSNGGL